MIMKRYDYLKGNQFAKGHKPNITSFPKGHCPWNKGKKGIHLSPATEFKKNGNPINLKPIGTITIRIEKNKKERRWIKIAEPNKWIEYAKFIWIKNNGEIPKGFVVHHRDWNSLNDDIENLHLLTRKELFEIHNIGRNGRRIRQENYLKEKERQKKNDLKISQMNEMERQRINKEISKKALNIIDWCSQ